MIQKFDHARILGEAQSLPVDLIRLMLLGLSVEQVLTFIVPFYPEYWWSVSLITIWVKKKEQLVWMIHAWERRLENLQQEFADGCPNAAIELRLFIDESNRVVEVC